MSPKEQRVLRSSQLGPPVDDGADVAATFLYGTSGFTDILPTYNRTILSKGHKMAKWVKLWSHFNEKCVILLLFGSSPFIL